jgi:hypothetical protein
MWRKLLQQCGFGIDDDANQKSEDIDHGDGGIFSLNAKQIFQLLEKMKDQASPVAILFKGAQSAQTSQILHIDHSTSQLYLRDSQPSISKKPSSALNLTIPYKSTSIILSSTISKQTHWNDLPCYVINVPHFMLSTEMREYARVRILPHHHCFATFRLSSTNLLRVPIQDICERGLRVKIKSTDQGMFDTVASSMVAIIESAHESPVEVVLRRRDCIIYPHSVELGFEITSLSEKAAQSLRRFMMKADASSLISSGDLHASLQRN